MTTPDLMALRYEWEISGEEADADLYILALEREMVRVGADRDELRGDAERLRSAARALLALKDRPRDTVSKDEWAGAYAGLRAAAGALDGSEEA